MNLALGQSTELEQREEYANFDKYFNHIGADFGFEATEQNLEAVRFLGTCMDICDQYIDEAEDPAEMDERIQAVRLYMQEGEISALPLELVANLSLLRERLIKAEALEKFMEHLEGIFVNTRIMRETKDVRTFIRASIEEGANAAFLLSDVADVEVQIPTEELRQRYQKCIATLGGIANLIDDVQDLEADYDNGEREITPTLELYTRSALSLAKEVVKFFILYPSKKTLLNFARMMIRVRRFRRKSEISE